MNANKNAAPSSPVAASHGVSPRHALALLEYLRASTPLASSFSLAAESLPAAPAPSLDQLQVELPPQPPLPSGEELEALLRTRLRDLLGEQAERQELASGQELRAGDEARVDVLGQVGAQVLADGTQMDAWVEVQPGAGIGGLFGQLAGQKVGQRVELEVVLPADYPEEPLRGQRARFVVRIHEAHRLVNVPSAEDPQALARLGRGYTQDQVLDSLADELGQELELASAQEAGLEVMAELARRVKAQVPPQALEEELRRGWHQEEGRVLERLEVPAARLKASLEAWRADAGQREAAEQRLKVGLALRAIIAEDGLKLTPMRLHQLLEEADPDLWLQRSEIQRRLESGQPEEKALLRTALYLLAVDYAVEHAEVVAQRFEAEG